MMPAETLVTLPVIGRERAEKILEDRWGLRGTLVPLDGERDLNFRVRLSGQRKGHSLVFKICNAAEDAAMLECQEQVLSAMEALDGLSFSRVIPTIDGETRAAIRADDGRRHLCRVVDWVDGRPLSGVNPRGAVLHRSLGRCVARVGRVLRDFRHPALERPLPWDLCRALEVLEEYRLPDADTDRAGLIAGFSGLYRERVLAVSNRLRRGAIHNDANDNNVLVGQTTGTVCGLIDFGDILYGWLVADVAIACAYAMLDSDHPLDVAADIVSGYHEVFPLSPEEIGVVFPLACMRLCLCVCISIHQQIMEPGNAYLGISEEPAWRMLDTLSGVPPDFATYLFRDRCGLEPVPGSAEVADWLSRRKGFSPLVDPEPAGRPPLILDLGVASPEVGVGWTPQDTDCITRNLFRTIGEEGTDTGIGRYAEYRLVYDSDDFVDFSGHRRTLHLGLDVFQPAGSPVYAPLAGTVHSMADYPAKFDYGGILILRHETGTGHAFYTLYGHLDPDSLLHLTPGDPVGEGRQLGRMGDSTRNGDWPPHVHFEIITDLLGYGNTFLGVGSHAHRDVWLSLCPDPNLILRLTSEGQATPLVPPPVNEHPSGNTESGQSRAAGKGGTAAAPFPGSGMVRGAAQYLYDATGRRFLDGGSPDVILGHCHPAVTRAAQERMTVLQGPVPGSHALVRELSEALGELAGGLFSRVLITDGLVHARELAAEILALNGYQVERPFQPEPGIIVGEGQDISQDTAGDPSALVVDESICALGRLGDRWWGFEGGDRKPDLILLGNVLANGCPLGAVLVNNRFADSGNLEHWSRAVSPVSCAAAAATLAELSSGAHFGHAYEMGRRLECGLTGLTDDHAAVKGIMVRGFCCLIEFYSDRHARYSALRLQQNGILVRVSDRKGRRLWFAPPLVAGERDMDRFAITLKNILGEDAFHRDVQHP